MVRVLKYNFFHSAMVLKYGEKFQVYKCIEELNELEEAVLSGDREKIIEELADVELTIPYVNRLLYGMSDMSLTCLNVPVDFMQAKELLCIVIDLRFRIGPHKFTSRMINDALFLMSVALYNLYVHHKLLPDEVDKMKEYKMRRSLKRAAIEIFGGNK